jgi:DNA-binding LacI/PurR family transcriptional regulator
MSRLTIRDLAKTLGISNATVSRALRNHPGLSKATCQRVQKEAQKAGYQVNPLVATLATQLRLSKKSPYQATLAYVTTFPSDSLRQGDNYYVFYAAAKARAEELGYQLEHFWLKSPGMTAKRATKILLARGIRGLIIAPMPHALGHLSLEWQHFAAVTLGYTMASPHLHSCCNYHAATMTLILRKLRKYGYQRIGLAIDKASAQYAFGNQLSRFIHYQSELPQKQRVPQFHGQAGKSEFLGNKASLLFGRWYQKYQPDAIVTHHPFVLDWVRKLGLKIPEQLGLATVDILKRDGVWAGVDCRSEVVASAGVDLVVQELQHNRLGLPEDPRVVMIEGRWMDGSTINAKHGLYL